MLLEYTRVELATKPVYGTNYVVGNLIETKKLIEDFLLQDRKGPIRKEIIPFLCVVNPPRHGKSLLLDGIFAGNENVLVISITYNTGTSFDSAVEINSTESATHFFWLRVMKSLLNSSLSLRDMTQEFNVKGIQLSSYDDVVNNISGKFRVDPFIIDSITKKAVLICVDEFSRLTDAIEKKWEPQQQQDFLNRIHNEKIPFHPFRQFLFTGFNQGMVKLLSHSSAIEPFTLKMCDYTSSRPLLEKIVKSYAERAVPAIFFECVKCTPGLIGQWAEFIVNGNRYPSSINEFRASVPWLYDISSGISLQNNWKLLVEYLIACEKDPEDYTGAFGRITDFLVAAGIGIGIGTGTNPSDIIPHFIPLCMALIIRFTEEHSLDPREQRLWRMMSSVLDVLNQANIMKKNGKDFESFVQRALMLRLALRSDETRVEIKLSSLLPGRIYKGTQVDTAAFNSDVVIEREYFFHGISSKEELKLFLLSPIYNLFPVGLATLSSKKSVSISPQLSLENPLLEKPSLQKWIEQKPALKVLQGFDMECDLVNSSLLNLSNADLPQLVSLVSKADNCPCSILQQFYYWLSQRSGLIDTSREGQIGLLDAFFSSLSGSSSFMTIDTMMMKHLSKWWRGIVERNLQIARCFENGAEASFICAPEHCPGLDLTLLWRGKKELGGYVDEYEYQEAENSPKGEDDRVVVHIAGIEIKDRQFTDSEEWNDKLAHLLSLRCVFWWLQLVHREKFDLKFHIIFAGREHNE